MKTINPLSALQTAMLEVHETSTDEPSWCQCSRNKKYVLRILTDFSCDEGHTAHGTRHTAHRYYEITPNLESIITLSCSPWPLCLTGRGRSRVDAILDALTSAFSSRAWDSVVPEAFCGWMDKWNIINLCSTLSLQDAGGKIRYSVVNLNTRPFHIGLYLLLLKYRGNENRG